MKTLKYVSLLLLLILFSCNKNTVAEQFDNNFKDNRWLESDMKNYTFTITDASKNYDLFFDFSHVDDYQFPTVPITLEIENPDKTILDKSFNLEIKDASGKQTGQCDGDYCDISYAVLKNVNLKAGAYKLKVSNSFPTGYLPNVIGVGFKVVISE